MFANNFSLLVALLIHNQKQIILTHQHTLNHNWKILQQTDPQQGTNKSDKGFLRTGSN